jgi:hypothetical protein
MLQPSSAAAKSRRGRRSVLVTVSLAAPSNARGGESLSVTYTPLLISATALQRVHSASISLV